MSFFVGFIEGNLGYWNSCNPMNRIAHLNWKGTIRMKYSPRLKETIISIFHNRNSRISIHVIFKKVDFDSPKCSKCSIWCGFPWFKMGFVKNGEYFMRHMAICGIQHGYFWFWKFHFWRNSNSFFRHPYLCRKGITLTRDRIQVDFDQINGWTFHLTEKKWIFSWNCKAVGSFPPEIRSTKMSIPVWSGSGV